MIYLDQGATSFPKPRRVRKAVLKALKTCGNPGRGGYPAAMAAAEAVYTCRERAADLFSCETEQVVLTGSCTQGLNIAIGSLFQKGDRVVISGFEHNAVVRTLCGLGMEPIVAGSRLFDWDNTLEELEAALQKGVAGAVFTHVSNVFGYILPIKEMAALLKARGLPFILDAAQSAGMTDLNFEALHADFIAMPGHKGLLGPEGTGILLCGSPGRPLLFGGTGTHSEDRNMPGFLPERLEAGTPNVPGISGLAEGLALVKKLNPERIGRKEARQAAYAGKELEKMGLKVFMGPHQAGTLSFLMGADCHRAADFLAQKNIALRAGLHCAPLAHKTAGTLLTGTLRASWGRDAGFLQTKAFLKAVNKGSVGIF